jgi:myo-inositol-1(or 4)-monophosphatase
MLATFMKELAITAGRHVRSLQASQPRAEQKSAKDFVTDADRQAAVIICSRLLHAFPHDRIMCEDARPEADRGERYLWIIDPLDGTTNFMHGYPSYAVSIARYDREQRRVDASVVYNPALDQLFSAQDREWPTLNGRPIRSSACARIESCLVLAGMSHQVMEGDPELDLFAALSVTSTGTRRSGCPSLDICYVAAGFADAYVHCNLMPWDFAAAAHILINAGGRITNFASRKLDLGMASVMATNGHCHQELAQLTDRFNTNRCSGESLPLENPPALPPRRVSETVGTA